MNRFFVFAVWALIATIIVVPLFVAANSPLLEWRDPIYIVAGFAGVIALLLVMLQPMLATGLLPGLSLLRGRRVHRWVGSFLVLAIIVHVLGLWITSPPDVIDALLFVSATPFSIWGVIAMWSVFLSAAIVLLRQRIRIPLRRFLISHRTLAVVTVIGSVVHAMLIEGTMGMVSKALLCAAVLVVTLIALFKRLWQS